MLAQFKLRINRIKTSQKKNSDKITIQNNLKSSGKQLLLMYHHEKLLKKKEEFSKGIEKKYLNMFAALLY